MLAESGSTLPTEREREREVKERLQYKARKLEEKDVLTVSDGSWQ